MGLCRERDSPIRQRVGLGDLKLPSILGFQSLCCIETEVNVESSVGLSPCGPRLWAACVSTFVRANPCCGARSGELHSPESKASFARQLHSWNSQDSSPFPPHIASIRFSWGGQKGHFPNHVGSQALIWIIQLIHREDTSWADLKPFWQEHCWFRLTRGHCWRGRMASSLLGEQNQVWEQQQQQKSN